ncbi:MAG: SH3 domain-containing protein [Chloroflexota bacterium]
MKTQHAIFLTLILLFSNITGTGAQDAVRADSCPGALPSRLVNGARGRVLPGSPNRLRADADTDSEILDEVPAGSTFSVLEGPECVEAMAWWQVRYKNQVGWTAEGQGENYWIEPSLLPDLEPISAVNASRLQPIALLGFNLINDVAWSPDGQTLVAAGSAGLWRFDLTQPEMSPYLVEGYEGFFHSLAYSPDGKFVVTGSEMGAIRLWDTTTWTQSAILQTSGESIEKVAFSADGTRLATGSSNGLILIWDVATETLFDEHDLGNNVNQYAFSADLSIVLADTQMVDLEVNKIYFLSEVSAIQTAAFGPSDQIVATGSAVTQENYDRGSLNLWLSKAGGESGLRVIEMFVGLGDISAVAFARGDLLASDGHTIFLWQISDLLMAMKQESPIRQGEKLARKTFVGSNSFTVSADGKSAALIYDDAVTLLDLDSGAITATLKIPLFTPGTYGFTYEMALSPTEPLLAFGSGNNIRLWNLQTGVEQSVLSGHSLDVLALDFSLDGQQLVSGSGDVQGYGDPGGEENAVRLWNLHAGSESIALPGYSNVVDQLAFSPDGSRVAAWAYFNGMIGLWDTASGQQTLFKSGAIEDVQVAFSPDSKLITMNQPTTGDGLQFLDAHSGEFRFALAAPDGGHLGQAVFSPDGAYLATVSGYPEKIFLWDTTDWTLHSTIEGDAPLTFSRDGKLLGFMCSHDFIVWDMDGQTEKFRISDSQGVAVFSADNKMVMVDGRSVWNPQTGEKLANINVIIDPEAELWRYSPVPCLFSADQQVIACNSTGGIRLWGVPVN